MANEPSLFCAVKTTGVCSPPPTAGAAVALVAADDPLLGGLRQLSQESSSF